MEKMEQVQKKHRVCSENRETFLKVQQKIKKIWEKKLSCGSNLFSGFNCNERLKKMYSEELKTKRKKKFPTFSSLLIENKDKEEKQKNEELAKGKSQK